VKRQTTMSVGAIWLVAVAASWVATTALLALLPLTIVTAAELSLAPRLLGRWPASGARGGRAGG
jgi:hypothetical protein